MTVVKALTEALSLSEFFLNSNHRVGTTHVGCFLSQVYQGRSLVILFLHDYFESPRRGAAPL